MKTLTRRQSGFSLIEVMVVLLIIGMMAALVAPAILGNQESAQLKKAAIDIQQLESAIQMYKVRTNLLPTTEQGLEALVSAPTIEPIPRNFPAEGFINRLPQDPWGNDYYLLSPGEMGTFDVFSAGPDMQPGTDDDIGNWNLNDFLN
ncbi:type II secretion system major pseudopilin GspG [Bowmanella sp. Y26]|uniref:Type II secretion system core protein G n=1 Tax=Bowmanella yangjiangensis TaxID=2811230 RepID=A0ABS3CPZ9_9ALTE|nr:type II secretion system major pseudopilin GspG [Bowmanella yangjiangensis]MBN7819169.1 type II secretion system major pseudopilin GspG [Bowmanella yangjiangensis]MBT1065846.1 type II secretion system major pseudopilin GspG [Bowmanella yangjiangensis]